MKQIQKTVELRVKGQYYVQNTVTDTFRIFSELASDLIAKKINHCRYIRSVKRVDNYDGTMDIIVTYDNSTRSVYTVYSF